MRYTVFHAYAEGIHDENAAMTNGNCVAKLAYGQYGWEAHQSLAPEFAPKLFGRSKSDANVVVYVMEYLPRPKHDRPGWIMLFDLADNLAAARLEEISQLLQAILTRLKNSGFVHGDLRPNNLMIKMAGDQIAEPLDIKVVDFEWAGRLNEACYPLDRSTSLQYPGNAGDLIGSDDDKLMIDRWQESMLTKFRG